jgi:hypothetical protein
MRPSVRRSVARRMVPVALTFNKARRLPGKRHGLVSPARVFHGETSSCRKWSADFQTYLWGRTPHYLQFCIDERRRAVPPASIAAIEKVRVEALIDKTVGFAVPAGSEASNLSVTPQPARPDAPYTGRASEHRQRIHRRPQRRDHEQKLPTAQARCGLRELFERPPHRGDRHPSMRARGGDRLVDRRPAAARCWRAGF